MRNQSRIARASSAARLMSKPIITVALALAATSAGAGAASPQPTSLPAPFGVARNGSFAYDLGGDIYVADPTGQSTVAIISGPDYEVGPTFSRDGTRIAFMRGSADGSARLMVAQTDGSGVIPLTGPVDEANWYDWSADGSLLALWHLIDGVPSISIVASDGSGMRTLDLGDIEPGDRVDWRPTDGHELIFTGHSKTGPPNVGLYAIAPDGTGLRTIGAVSTSDHWFNDFQLSADGTTVAYWAWGPNDAGVSDGWSHLRDLTTGHDRLIELYGDPRLSPDGTSILGETSQLVLGPADGSGPTRDIGPSYAGQDRKGYAYSPDGRKIMLTIGDPGATWIIDIASGESVVTPIPVLPDWQRLAP